MFNGMSRIFNGTKLVEFYVQKGDTVSDIEDTIRLFALAFADGAFFRSEFLKDDSDEKLKSLAANIASGRRVTVDISKKIWPLVEAYYVGERDYYSLYSPEAYELKHPKGAKPCLATGYGDRDERAPEWVCEEYFRAKEIITEVFQEKGLLEKPAEEKTEEAKTSEDKAKDDEEERFNIAPLDGTAQKTYLSLPVEKLRELLADLQNGIADTTCLLEDLDYAFDIAKTARDMSKEAFAQYEEETIGEEGKCQDIIKNANQHIEFIRQAIQDRVEGSNKTEGTKVEEGSKTEDAKAEDAKAETGTNTDSAADSPEPPQAEPTPDSPAASQAEPAAPPAEPPKAEPASDSSEAPREASKKKKHKSNSNGSGLGIQPKPAKAEPEKDENVAEPEPAEETFTASEILEELRAAGYPDGDEVYNDPELAKLVTYDKARKSLYRTIGPEEAEAVLETAPYHNITLSQAREILSKAGIQLD